MLFDESDHLRNVNWRSKVTSFDLCSTAFSAIGKSEAGDTCGRRDWEDSAGSQSGRPFARGDQPGFGCVSGDDPESFAFGGDNGDADLVRFTILSHTRFASCIGHSCNKSVTDRHLDNCLPGRDCRQLP